MLKLKEKVDRLRGASGNIAKKVREWRCVQRALSVVLSVALMLAFVPKTAFGALEDGWNLVDNHYEDDNGNWRISSVAGLVEFRDAVNGNNSFSGKTVSLTEDIDLASEAPWVRLDI